MGTPSPDFLAAERERQTQARIDELQAEIDRLQALNEVDRVRLRQLEHPFVGLDGPLETMGLSPRMTNALRRACWPWLDGKNRADITIRDLISLERWRLEYADGVGPRTLAAVDRWMERAAGLDEPVADERGQELVEEAREQVRRSEPWPLERFDPWSELTRERDGYREDAIAEQHERERQGY